MDGFFEHILSRTFVKLRKIFFKRSSVTKSCISKYIYFPQRVYLTVHLKSRILKIYFTRTSLSVLGLFWKKSWIFKAFLKKIVDFLRTFFNFKAYFSHSLHVDCGFWRTFWQKPSFLRSCFIHYFIARNRLSFFKTLWISIPFFKNIVYI